MSRLLLVLLGLAWALFAAWLYTASCCSAAVAGGAATTTAAAAGGAAANAALWKVTDGSKTVADASASYGFKEGSAIANIPEANKEGLKELADYLKNNPKKTLTLSGMYTTAEGGSHSGFANLGEARAAAIKTRLVANGGDAKRIFTKGMNHKSGKFDREDGMVYRWGVVKAPAKNNASSGLSIRDGSLLAATAGGNFLFDKDGFRVNQPIQGDVKNALQKTVTHLKKNPDKVVTITGPYGKNEKNTGAFENLGIARANSVKNEMVTLGASRSQIETNGRLINNIKFNNKNKLVGGVNFAFSKAKKNDDKLAKIEKRLKIGPKYLYFETGKDVVKLNSELRKYFADLVYYLDRKPNAKVNVVGHTDSQGGRASNIKLGQGRADFVKKYLANNGTGTKQIRTSSKGPDQPIDSNDTASGRQKNRRVEVRVP